MAVLLPGKSSGQRSLVGYRPKGRKELDTTERLYLLTHSQGKTFTLRERVPLPSPYPPRCQRPQRYWDLGLGSSGPEPNEIQGQLNPRWAPVMALPVSSPTINEGEFAHPSKGLRAEVVLRFPVSTR